jgi:hypothetical protein
VSTHKRLGRRIRILILGGDVDAGGPGQQDGGGGDAKSESFDPIGHSGVLLQTDWTPRI